MTDFEKEVMSLIQETLDIIEDLVDDEECSFDHNGDCQAHGYFGLDQGEVCPQERAKRFIKKYK